MRFLGKLDLLWLGIVLVFGCVFSTNAHGLNDLVTDYRIYLNDAPANTYLNDFTIRPLGNELRIQYPLIQPIWIIDSAGALGIAKDLIDIPVGGVGQGKLVIHGAQNSTSGPHIQITNSADNYPVLCLSSQQHDKASIDFDMYFDGSNTRSSDAGSNARIVKEGDKLELQYRGGRPVGDVVNAMDAIALDLVTGGVSMPEVYGVAVSGNVRPLKIKSDGTLGYTASSIRFKENVRDALASDTEWVFALRPVSYTYKAPLDGDVELGLLAEEVSQVRPEMVSYVRNLVHTEPTAGDQQGGNQVVEMTETPETVNYEGLVTPLLAEIQKLKADLVVLRTRVAQLKSK
ncbi:MAG: tail fiber domain-containing protein [Candidatus Hydrogenedentes bacterium]|nr:tail fiber domain-containing protein [Candidatus Hydrogenedentota bacterium]